VAEIAVAQALANHGREELGLATGTRRTDGVASDFEACLDAGAVAFSGGVVSDQGERVAVWLTKSQLAALMDLVYRGKVLKRELRRAAVSLESMAKQRGAVEVYLTRSEVAVIISSARTGRREDGLVEATESCRQIYDSVERQFREKPKRKIQPRLDNTGPRRRCMGCSKLRPASHFIGSRGIRCVECRKRGVTANKINVVRGGSPSLGRRQ